jgi:cobalt-zinc-cadmium efflux system protein
MSTADFGKVAVLLGGSSAEREVSLKSGAMVLNALRDRGVDAHAFDPDEHGLDELIAAGFERAFIVLHGGDRENLNIRGAALHVAGDLLGSVAAIVAAVVIILTGWMPIDPILSVGVAMLILRSAWVLVKRSAHVLLEGAPEWLDVVAMQQLIVSRVPGVGSIHHVHVWGLTPQHLMLTMHVRVDDEPGRATNVIRDVKAVLRDEYGIGHSTIEIEREVCADH